MRTVTERFLSEVELFWQAEVEALSSYSAGLSSTIDLENLYQRYAWLFCRETISEILDARDEQSPNSLAGYSISRFLQGSVASLDDEIFTAMANSQLQIGNEKIPFFASTKRLANEPDPDKRLLIYQARQASVSYSNSLREKRWSSLCQQAQALGFSSYASLFEMIRGVNLDLLRQQSERFLALSADQYFSSLRSWSTPILGRSDLCAADFFYILRGALFDHQFQPHALESCLVDTSHKLGFDLSRDGRVEIDLVARERKSPRPFTAYIKVPDRIKMVINPKGGYSDFTDSFHELGHALFGISIDPGLTFSNRYLGDDTVGEANAFLFEHLVSNFQWLKKYHPGWHASQFMDYAKFIHLTNARRLAAKLIYETRSLSTDKPSSELYSETLSKHLGVVIPPDFYLMDIDDGLYSSQYLRGWMLEAALESSLRVHFGPEWFSDPAAGDYLRSLWSSGQPALAEDIARRLGYELDPLLFAQALS